jgi:phage-related protein
MPSIGPRCHELRIVDETATWRVVYRIDVDAIVIADVFSKKTAATPKPVIDACGRRLRVLFVLSITLTPSRRRWRRTPAVGEKG